VPGLPARTDAFPALPAAPKATVSTKTAWSASAKAISTTRQPTVRVHSIAATQPKPAASNQRPAQKADFPDLPTSQAAASRAAARDLFNLPERPQRAGWGQSADPSPTEEAPQAAADPGKGKKKAKKQILFAISA
jgi:hypothetical protein